MDYEVNELTDGDEMHGQTCTWAVAANKILLSLKKKT